MADYYPLVAAAIAGLVKDTSERRRALYDRARTSLVAQLRGMGDPPLTEAEITRERLALEEAIRKVEAESVRRSASLEAEAARRSASLEEEMAKLLGRSPKSVFLVNDYYPLVAKAISGLAKNVGEARRNQYDRARTALVVHLRGMNNPPLTEAEITRQRLALEEAIREVEAESAAPQAPTTRHALEEEMAKLIGESPEAAGPKMGAPSAPPPRVTPTSTPTTPTPPTKTKMSATATKPFIFVSYRRNDSPGTTVLICEKLSDRFGSDSVFQDVESIPPGRNFRKHIADAVEKADVMLVLIGPRWLATDEHGLYRISSENDFVRIEIEFALRRNLPIIPVLLDGALMPHPRILPPTVQPLLDQQAVAFHSLYERDRGIQRLVAGINGILNSAA